MSSEKRQLAAILFADIKGYTALMQENERHTAQLLSKFQQALKEQTAECKGKIINFYGDGCLAVFEDALDAVRCAGSLQVVFQRSPQVPVRIGVHLGDVVFKEGNVYGDSINLTSRIESIGVPGAVLFSEAIRQAIENHSVFKIAYLGKFNFKNIKPATKVYALANQEFVVPNKRNLTGKLAEPEKDFTQKVISRAKSALAVIGIFALLIALNYPDIKSFLHGNLSSTPIKEKKVAVMFFDNETGDEQLSGVGKMAADWITQQLMAIEKTQVVLSSNVRNNIHLATASLEGIQQFAEATGAEVIIDGRYYQSGEQLILQARVIKAQTGEVIHTLTEPVIGDKADPLPLIQEVSQRITGFWAVQDRKQFNEKPPKLGAYHAYLEGRKYWGLDFRKVEEYYLIAYQIDSTFLVPLVELVASKINESDYYGADSLLQYVDERKERLSKVHQLQTKAYAAQLNGKLEEAVSYWEKIYAIDAKEFITVTNLSRQYLNTNQVQKAIKVLEKFDYRFLDFQECFPCQEYYELLTYAYFQQRDFHKVVKTVENFNFEIKEGLIANYYLKSLVHLGDFDKVYEKMGYYLGQDLSFNGGRQSAGLLLVGLLFEFQKDKQDEISDLIANLLVNYGESNEDDWLSDYYIGTGLYGKGKHAKAIPYFDAFYKNYPQVPMIIDLGLASLASCYIHQKEFDQLETIYKYLSTYDHPYAASFVTYAKAKMEAQLGHKEKAIALLQESKQQGQEFLWFKFQNDPFFLPLFEETDFKALVVER